MKLRSITESKNNKRFNQILVGIILIGMLSLSILGYAMINNDRLSRKEKIVYNGIDFINQNNYWIAEINGFQFAFRYNPFQVAEINSFVNPLNYYYDEPLYIQSEDDLASAEIYNNLNVFVERIQPACLNESSINFTSLNSNYSLNCKGDYPIKTCDNNFIIIQESNFTNIRQENNCVFIQAPKSDLINVSDEFLFKILGID